jgi:hypothetical protein
MTMKGAATGGAPTLTTAGSTANIPLTIATKGTGAILFKPGNQNCLQISSTSAGVNYLNVSPASTGTDPYIEPIGSDANIGLRLRAKGSGSIWLSPKSQNTFKVSSVLNGQNYVSVTNAVIAGQPFIMSEGVDTNIAMQLASKGTGSIVFNTNANATKQAEVSHTASAVNYVNLTGAATGTGPVISSLGTDTNIDLNLTPKGTGVVKINAAGGIKFSDNTVMTTAPTGGGADTRIASNPTFVTNPQATGNRSIALGDGTVANTDYSVAIGYAMNIPYANVGKGVIAVGTGFTQNATYAAAYSVVIGHDCLATNGNSVTIGNGASTNGFGNSQSVAIGAYSLSTGTNATSLGYQASAGSGTGGIAIGAYTSGSSNGVAIGYGATTTGTGGIAIGGGGAGRATASTGICLYTGGASNYPARGTSTISIGWHFNSQGSPTANNSILLNSNGVLGNGFGSNLSNVVFLNSGGSSEFTVGETYQVAIGNALKPRLFGQVMIKATKGFEVATCDSVFSTYETRAKTTNATQTRMFLNYSDYTTGTKYALIQDSSANFYKGRIIARSTTNEMAVWEISGAIRKGTTVGSTELIGSVIKTTIAKSTNATNWDVTVSADTTNGALDILVTGAASTTIRWYGKIELQELIA